jgi:hypothetical protein
VITLNVINDWDLVDIDNISGRLNVMWLTPEGIGISTRDYSHMTILNMICEKSNVHDFWDIEEIKKHNVDDVIQLNYKELKHIKNMNTKHVEFGGSEFGHASKLLEKRDFVYNCYNGLTEKQTNFINKVIDTYNLSKEEIQEEIYYD